MNATVSKNTGPSPWKRVGGSLVAEVLGLERVSFDPAARPAIESAMIEHHVVGFYAQSAFIDESQPMLRFLFDFPVKLEFCSRHRWLPDEAVTWNDRSVLHGAIHAFGGVPGARAMNHVQTKCEAVL